MITTISPLVQVAWWRGLRSLIAYVCASAAAAVGLGALLGTAGGVLLRGLPSQLPLAFAGVLSVMAVLHDSGVLHLRLPAYGHSVPQSWWRHWGEVPASAAYGARLGIGVSTAITLAGFYVVLALTILAGDGVAGASVLGTYGVMRAAPTVAAAVVIRAGLSPVDVATATLNARPLVRALSTAVLVCLVFACGLALLASA